MKKFSGEKSCSLVSSLAAGMVCYGLATSAVVAQEMGNPEFSANVAITSDYVFRGISQSDEHPAVQGGFDVSWGQFYAGVWGSSIDFGAVNGRSIADVELDVYAGWKRQWTDRFETDLGVIYYMYPDAFDPTGELDFFEIKLANSLQVTEQFSLTATAFYSPDYTGELGQAWTFEGGAELKLPRDFKLSGAVGTTQFENAALDDYTYWNVGMSVDFMEKFTLDARYHGSDCTLIGDSGKELCGDRVAATLSASF